MKDLSNYRKSYEKSELLENTILKILFNYFINGFMKQKKIRKMKK